MFIMERLHGVAAETSTLGMVPRPGDHFVVYYWDGNLTKLTSDNRAGGPCHVYRRATYQFEQAAQHQHKEGKTDETALDKESSG